MATSILHSSDEARSASIVFVVGVVYSLYTDAMISGNVFTFAVVLLHLVLSAGLGGF